MMTLIEFWQELEYKINEKGRNLDRSSSSVMKMESRKKGKNREKIGLNFNLVIMSQRRQKRGMSIRCMVYCRTG